MVESALYKSCIYYVSLDNTLNYEGEVAIKCTTNSAIIGGGAASVEVPLGFVTRGYDCLPTLHDVEV